MSKQLHCPTLKYTVTRDRRCAICVEKIRKGELAYRDDSGPDEFRHTHHGPVGALPSRVEGE